MARIELRNRDGDVIDYAIVDDEHYEHLNQFRWGKHEGYVFNSSLGLLHRYIAVKFKNIHLEKGQLIDHIDRNPLNNKVKNLRLATRKDNARNRSKCVNASSKFRGVCKLKDGRFFSSYTQLNGKKITKSFKIEILAAHQFNLWVDLDECQVTNKNQFTDEEKNIIEKEILRLVVRKKKLDEYGNELLKGIDYSNGSYRVAFKSKYYGRFKILEEAINKLNSLKTEYEQYQEKQEIIRLSTPIRRNNNGHAIIEISGNEKNRFIIIDDEFYYQFQLINFYLNEDGYPRGYFDDNLYKGKLRVDRYIYIYLMGNDGSSFFTLNQLNEDKLDLRQENLDVTTRSKKSYNTVRKSNKVTSKHRNVFYAKKVNKFKASIVVDGKIKNLGSFNDEDTAARARDQFVIENNIPTPLNFK